MQNETKLIDIAIDIDGCLNNFQTILREIIKRDYNVETPIHDPDMLKHIGLIEYPQWRAFWDKYNPELTSKLHLEKDAANIMATLRRQGYRLSIITAREYVEGKMTEGWLKREGAEYDMIYMNGATKIGVCNWKNIKIMVEDTPKNIMALAEGGVTVLMFVRPYNEHIKHPNVIPCHNWEDVYENIISLTEGE